MATVGLRDAREMTASGPALLDFACPRCATPVEERFYGPCANCRGDLRSRLGGDGREVEVEAYEPKMNVTPNFVATKE